MGLCGLCYGIDYTKDPKSTFIGWQRITKSCAMCRKLRLTHYIKWYDLPIAFAAIYIVRKNDILNGTGKNQYHWQCFRKTIIIEQGSEDTIMQAVQEAEFVFDSRFKVW